MFQRIRNEKSYIIKKVKPLDGDMSMHNLGLTDEQREKLMNEVDIVFHLGATVRIADKLKTPSR